MSGVISQGCIKRCSWRMTRIVQDIVASVCCISYSNMYIFSSCYIIDSKINCLGEPKCMLASKAL